MSKLSFKCGDELKNSWNPDLHNFTDEKLMSKIDGLVELSGLKYIK